MPPPSPETPTWQRAARVVLALLLLGLGLFVVDHFIHALLWGAILVVATWPLYSRAGRHIGPGKHNVLLPALFTAGTTLIVVVPLILLAIQVGREAGTVSGYVQEVRTHGAPVPALLGRLPVGRAQATAWWQDNLADPEGARALLGRFDRTQLMDVGRGFGSRVLRGGFTFVFTLLTMFFLYRDGRVFRAQLLTASRRLFGPSGERVGRQMVASIHGTVDGLVLVGLGEGVLIGIAYVVAGVQHPALLGAATAIGAMVPLGATVVLAVAGLLLLVAGKTAGAIGVVAVGLVVVFVADHFIRPALIGGATRLPFLWVLLGILGGVESFGLLGLFLGPAIMAALILLWREWVGDATTDASAPPAPPALPAAAPSSPALDA